MPITAADIVRPGHGLAWYQQHYGAQHLGAAGPYLLVLAVMALAVIVVSSLIRHP